jgi:hypothetical protein
MVVLVIIIIQFSLRGVIYSFVAAHLAAMRIAA